MTIHNASRRLFLRQASALSVLGSAGAPLALNLAAIGSAAAQSANGYKALVCIFLYGGNDSFNTVLATDPTSWLNYGAVRNQEPDSIALLAPGTPATLSAAAASPSRLGGVLPIVPANAQGRSYALHPLMSGLQTLFNVDKRLAILPNIGPLITPTTKAQYSQAFYPKPDNLFSHNDQQNTWLALAPEGATRGWGGRMADMLAAQNGKAVFTSISAGGNAVWLSGETVRQYQVSSSGAIQIGTESNGKLFGSDAALASLRRVVGATRDGHVLAADLAAVSQRSIDAEAALRPALRPAGAAPFGTAPASGAYVAANDPRLQYDRPLAADKAVNSLAQQLQIVARMIDAGANGLGVKRQIFFVNLSGFDTHDSQNRNQADLLARLSHGIQYFDETLGAMGMRDQVTTFTASDFGRAFTSNGDGTDHGWGAHHFVMGGSVKGGDLYGRFPVLGEKNAGNNRFDSSPDQLANGALLPETSVDQLGATLGRWFGLNDAQLADVFPHLANFDVSKRSLGFMSA